MTPFRLHRPFPRRALAALAGLAALAAVPPSVPSASAVEDLQAAAPPAHYAGNASKEAGLVAQQQAWVQDLRTKASILRWTNRTAAAQPQLDSSTNVPTWVLPARRAPYTVKDLLTLQAAVQQRDGGVLLSANLFVPYGARLDLGGAGGPFRLRSDAGGFTAIVVYGGRLDLTGTQDKPLQVASWDRATQLADTATSDGRAYIRVIGGQLHMAYAAVSDLGFWSGVTGGVSLTGTGRTTPLTIASPPAKGNTAKGRRKDAAGGRSTTSPAAKLRLTPANALDHLPYAPGEELSTTASIVNSTLSGNAYGLFVSGADGLAISDSLVERSLVDGVTLQRYVVAASVSRTISRNNAGDGFHLGRGSQGVRMLNTTAEGNRGDGFLLDGSPLATGPSATGADVRSYGDNTVSASVARRNGRYGVEVVGGSRITVSGDVVEQNPEGVVVRGTAQGVTVSGNSVTGSSVRTLTVRDGAADVTVSGNTFADTRTGVYIRNASAAVSGNAVRDGSQHAVSLVGAVGGTTVSSNTFAGRGPSAVDAVRATGAYAIADNRLSGWTDTSSSWSKVRKLWRLGLPLLRTFGSSLPVHPLTLMWLLILGGLFATSLATRRPTFPGYRHPYFADRPATPLPRQQTATSAPRAGGVDLRAHEARLEMAGRAARGGVAEGPGGVNGTGELGHGHAPANGSALSNGHPSANGQGLSNGCGASNGHGASNGQGATNGQAAPNGNGATNGQAAPNGNGGSRTRPSRGYRHGLPPDVAER